MTIEALRAVARTLEDNLQAISVSQSFVKYANDLRKTGNIVWDAVPPEQKSLLENFFKEKAFNPEDVNRALYAVACAALEGFVRALLQTAVQEVGQLYPSFDDMPTKLRTRNYIVSGRALAKIADRPDHWTIDFMKLAGSIGACVPGSKQATLSSEAFSLFIGQVTPESLKEVFGGAGIVIDWAEIARYPKMKKLVQDVKNPPTEVQNKLTAVIRVRNRIVHMGEGLKPVTYKELEEAIDFVGALAEALVVQVEKRIERRSFAF